ncbi:hypothetical protein ARMSODRAFT_983832 [Armillaria solidipes]|uniref:Uncharacterized protein n=1 Tax=Armillaria solidipes TaxID=1076256 RepID=A0A2H3B5X2_9AGAR|nr:hypothetical protein ARMSODRAFT_983832 [Armillaria solidipes]
MAISLVAQSHHRRRRLRLGIHHPSTCDPPSHYDLEKLIDSTSSHRRSVNDNRRELDILDEKPGVSGTIAISSTLADLGAREGSSFRQKTQILKAPDVKVGQKQEKSHPEIDRNLGVERNSQKTSIDDGEQRRKLKWTIPGDTGTGLPLKIAVPFNVLRVTRQYFNDPIPFTRHNQPLIRSQEDRKSFAVNTPPTIRTARSPSCVERRLPLN